MMNYYDTNELMEENPNLNEIEKQLNLYFDCGISFGEEPNEFLRKRFDALMFEIKELLCKVEDLEDELEEKERYEEEEY